MSELRDLLLGAAASVADYREHLGDAPVFPPATMDELRAGFARDLPDGPTPPADVVAELVAAATPGIVATSGQRYFGFVIGGSLDVAVAADFLTTGWDQFGSDPATSPAATVVAEIAGGWLKDLLGIPASASVGFVTGGQAANTVSLSAARHHVLAAAGWDVERDGLVGAPRVRVVAGRERHATIDRALRFVGLGTGVIEEVAAGDQGAVDVADLGRVLAASAAPATPVPPIVVLQAGNVNSGACDDLRDACAVAHEHDAWVHVDGAFGLWAGASPATRHLVDGVETADSWACDGHKWLNVPYDSGYVFCAHPPSHAAAMAYTASYLEGRRDGDTPSDYAPESSRRARELATWAALRQLGRHGVAELVERCCRLARRFAELLEAADGIEVVNDVVLNQVVVDFGGDDRTEHVIDAVQRSGETWMAGTTWHDRRLMRISVSNWSTTDADVDRAVAAIRRAAG